MKNIRFFEHRTMNFCLYYLNNVLLLGDNLFSWTWVANHLYPSIVSTCMCINLKILSN